MPLQARNCPYAKNQLLHIISARKKCYACTKEYYYWHGKNPTFFSIINNHYNVFFWRKMILIFIPEIAFRCQTTNSPITNESSPFSRKKFLSLCSIVNTTEWNRIIKSDNWSKIYRDYYEPKFAIFNVSVFRSMTFHCKILKMPWNFDRT